MPDPTKAVDEILQYTNNKGHQMSDFNSKAAKIDFQKELFNNRFYYAVNIPPRFIDFYSKLKSAGDKGDLPYEAVKKLRMDSREIRLAIVHRCVTLPEYPDVLSFGNVTYDYITKLKYTRGNILELAISKLYRACGFGFHDMGLFMKVFREYLFLDVECPEFRHCDFECIDVYHYMNDIIGISTINDQHPVVFYRYTTGKEEKGFVEKARNQKFYSRVKLMSVYKEIFCYG